MLKDQKGTLVQQDQQDLKEIQGQQVHLDLREVQVRKDLPDLQVLPVPIVLLQDLPVQQVQIAL